jgi:sRNA-binding protein
MKQSIFRELMLKDLSAILGCAPDAVPVVLQLEGRPRPLKLRIDADMRARFPGAEPAKVSRWLKLWATRANYIKGVAQGAVRFDLDNNPAGTVSDSERDHALKQIDGHRKAAERTKLNGAPSMPAPRVSVGGRPILSLSSSASLARASH